MNPEEYQAWLAQAYIIKQQQEQQAQQQTTTPPAQVEPAQPPVQEPQPPAQVIEPSPVVSETSVETTETVIPQSVEQRETQITTAIAEQDAGRQAIQQAIAMGLMSQSALQEFEQSLKDITLKKEDITRLREEISDYERYLTELEDASKQGGYTLAGEDLTPELVEQKRQEYKEYLDKRVQTTVALTSPFSDLTTGKLSLASAINVGASQEQIDALAQTISNNMPESTRVEPERLIELTKTFDEYRKGEDYNIGKVISETVNGNLNRQDVQDYFGKDTIDKVDISVKLQNYKTGEEYNLEAIMDGLERGTVNRSDVETLFGKDTLNFIRNYNEQVETVQKETRNVIANEASNKGIDLKDINKPSFTEIEGLIRSGVDPINLVAAGYNVNDINIAVAVINQEAQEWQNARDKLANAGFALPLQQLTESYQDTLPFMVTPSGKEFSKENLAEYARNNPEEWERTVKAYFKDSGEEELVQVVQEYNDLLSEATNEINSYINTPEKTGLKSQGIALDTAITELYEGVKAPGIEVKFIGGNNVFYDVETGESLSEKEVLEKRWEQLTPSQREEVALAFANDPNKYNLFASTNQIFKLASEKGGIVSQFALAPITNVTNPIAKQMTLGEAKEIINREYESEREILKNYIKQDGTFDINKLTRETGTDYEYRNQLLEQAGYEDIDVLKQNLEYYNNSVKVTGGEIALAGAQVAADAASLLTLGGSGLLAGWAGKGLYGGLMTGSGGLMLAAGMPTLTSENTSALEKGLAVGIPILLISGGVIGMLPKLGGTTSQIGKVNVKVAQPKITPLERIGNALDNTAYKISKFIADESTRTVKAPNIALPNVIKMVRDASGKISYELVGLGKQSALAAEKAVQEIVEQALKAKVYLKSGLKQEVIEALSNNLTQAKIAKGLAKYVAEEIKVGITKGVQFTDDMIERAIVKGMATKDYLVGVSDDVRKAIVNSPQYVKYLAKEIGRNVNDRYNAIMDGLMVKGIMVTNQVTDTMATVMQNIKNIPTTVARKAELTKYMYGVVKDDIIKIAGMTKDEAEKFIKQQIENAIKLQNKLEALPDNVDGAIGYMSKEVVRNIKQSYARIEELRQEVLSTLIEDSFKAVDYLKYGLKEDIIASINSNKKIAKYLVDRTKSGIERGTIDAYSSANFKTILSELDDAVKVGNKQSMINAAEKLISLGDDVPRYQGVNLAELGRGIRAKLVKSGDIVDEDTVKAIEEWLNGIKKLEDLTGTVTVDDVVKYLKAEYKPKIVRDIEGLLKESGASVDDIAKNTDELMKRTTLDEVDRWLRGQQKPKIIRDVESLLSDSGLSEAETTRNLDNLIKQSTLDDLQNYLKAEYKPQILRDIDDILKDMSAYTDDAASNLDELMKRTTLDDLDRWIKGQYKPNVIKEVERILQESGLSPDDIAKRTDDLMKRTTLDDLQSMLNEARKVSEKANYQKELEGLLDELGDKLDDLDEGIKNNPDITPDEMDDIVRGDKGGGTAVKEKTEVKPKTETKTETKTKTAEELDELFKEKTKPEVKTETKPTTKVSTGIGVIAPVTVIKSTFLGEELVTPTEEIPSEKPPEIEPMVSPMKPSIIPIIKPVTPMPEIRDIPSIQIAPITGDEISEEVETFREVQPLKEPERLPETLGSEMFSVSPEEVQEPSEMPYPEPLKQPQPEAVEYPTPVTEETPYPELFVRPVTETPIPPDVPVKTPVKPISPIPLPELELEEGEKQGKVYKPGTVVFIQGRPNGGAMFKVFEPPMYEMETVREVPQGYVDEGWEGEGLSQKSLQVIGGMPDRDIKNLDLGVFRINILNENGQPKIEYVQDKEANSGSRSETIGMGKGQIPIEVWKDAKEKGISREELVKGLNEPYEKLEERLTKEVVEEVEEPPMRKPSNVSNWWEEESEMPVKMNEKLYRGRRILPPQIGG